MIRLPANDSDKLANLCDHNIYKENEAIYPAAIRTAVCATGVSSPAK